MRINKTKSHKDSEHNLEFEHQTLYDILGPYDPPLLGEFNQTEHLRNQKCSNYSENKLIGRKLITAGHNLSDHLTFFGFFVLFHPMDICAGWIANFEWFG